MSPTNEAWLFGNEAKVVVIPNSSGMADGKLAPINGNVSFLLRVRVGSGFYLPGELLKAFGEQRAEDFGVMLAFLGLELWQRIAEFGDRFLVSLPKRRGRIGVAKLLEFPAGFSTILDRVLVFAQALACCREHGPSNCSTRSTALVPEAKDPYTALLPIIERQPKWISKRHQRPLHGIGFGFLDRTLMGLAEIEPESVTRTTAFPDNLRIVSPHPHLDTRHIGTTLAYPVNAHDRYM